MHESLSSSPTIVSIGYERRSIDELVTELTRVQVKVLVDVRLNAISRKKGFSKSALASALSAAGIEYRHERELGNPKDNRDAFRQGLPAARKRYRDHLANGANSTYASVIDLARRNSVALLCYEREHTECHRSSIADRAQSDHPGVRILQI